MRGDIIKHRKENPHRGKHVILLNSSLNHPVNVRTAHLVDVLYRVRTRVCVCVCVLNLCNAALYI